MPSHPGIFHESMSVPETNATETANIKERIMYPIRYRKDKKDTAIRAKNLTQPIQCEIQILKFKVQN